jgi:hypothetical protein
VTWNGFHEARINGRVTQDIAQRINGSIQTFVEVDKCVIEPQPLAEFLAV